MRTRRRPDKTTAWTAAKVLIFAGLVALGIAANVTLRPQVNPGVQDCGTPISFFLENRENVLVHPGEPGAPANAVALASQPTCRERASVEVEKAALAVGAFLGLTLLGIILGLLDDRIAYWRSPRFESMLRDMPRSSRIEHGLIANVDVDDLGGDLPPLESPEVFALVFFGFAAFFALPFAGPLDSVRVATSHVMLAPLLAGLVVCAGSFLASAAQRKAVLAREERWITTIELVIATSWVGRLRPVLGAFGIDIHRLRKIGIRRDDAVAEVQALQSVSVVVHFLLLGLSSVIVIESGQPDVHYERPQLVLVGVVALFILSGLSRSPRRLRALAVRPGIPSPQRLIRLGWTPPRVVALMAATVMVTGTNVGVLALSLHSFGGEVEVGIAQLLFVFLVATNVGALGPTPGGVGVFEGTAALLLIGLGVEPGVAIAASLAFRALTFWLPMIVAVRAWQRLRSANIL